MSREGKAWLHATAWALVALLRGIQIGSVIGILFAALGVAYCLALTILTRRDDETEKGSPA